MIEGYAGVIEDGSTYHFGAGARVRAHPTRGGLEEDAMPGIAGMIVRAEERGHCEGVAH